MHTTQTPAAPTAATACTPPTCQGSASAVAAPASTCGGECSPLHRDCMGLSLKVGDKVSLGFLSGRAVKVLALLPCGRFVFRRAGQSVTFPSIACVKVAS